MPVPPNTSINLLGHDGFLITHKKGGPIAPQRTRTRRFMAKHNNTKGSRACQTAQGYEDSDSRSGTLQARGISVSPGEHGQTYTVCAAYFARLAPALFRLRANRELSMVPSEGSGGSAFRAEKVASTAPLTYTRKSQALPKSTNSHSIGSTVGLNTPAK
jgi:hypothetical protein